MRPLLLLCSLTFATVLHAQDLPPSGPNSQKYKDSSIANGKGRSGSAAIEARALLGRDGVTTLDVTTSSFESTTAAPGSIDKVKVKVEATGSAFNYDGSGTGTLSRNLEKLARHEPLQITANVSGIDPARTDVVTVKEIVKLRPNLIVMPDVAPVVMAEVPIQIDARVAEMNGDVGARGNCVLEVDGVEVDRANNIWVNAGGEVACRFSHVFPTPGTKYLTMRITDVTPGDYRLDDNVLLNHPIEVRPHEDFDFYYAFAQDIEIHEKYDAVASWREEHWSRTGWRNMVRFEGAVPKPLMNFDNLTANLRVTRDGQVVDDLSNVPLTRTTWGFENPDGSAAKGGCARGWQSYRWITACGAAYRMPDGTWNGSMNVNVLTSSGDVTYHSEGWDKTYLDRGYDYWTWNYDQNETYGHGRRFNDASQLSLDVTVSDGTTTFDAHPQITLDPVEWQWNSSFCWETWDGPMCGQYANSENGTRGSAMFFSY